MILKCRGAEIKLIKSRRGNLWDFWIGNEVEVLSHRFFVVCKHLNLLHVACFIYCFITITHSVRSLQLGAQHCLLLRQYEYGSANIWKEEEPQLIFQEVFLWNIIPFFHYHVMPAWSSDRSTLYIFVRALSQLWHAFGTYALEETIVLLNVVAIKVHIIVEHRPDTRNELVLLSLIINH